MLFYFGHGQRDFNSKAARVRPRMYWEFAAILSGSAMLSLPEADTGHDKPALYIFPPRHRHGWSRGKCEHCFVHLSACPRLVADAAHHAEDGYLYIPWAEGDIATVQKMSDEMVDLLERHPNAHEIAADRFRSVFSEIAVRNLNLKPAISNEDGYRRVREYLYWLEMHLSDGVGVQQAAQACHLSMAHLRRLCHQTTGRGPRDLLDELRLNRARDLLRLSDAELESIALDCGYGSATALSQAFMRRFGVRPGKWRSMQEA